MKNANKIAVCSAFIAASCFSAVFAGSQDGILGLEDTAIASFNFETIQPAGATATFGTLSVNATSFDTVEGFAFETGDLFFSLENNVQSSVIYSFDAPNGASIEGLSVALNEALQSDTAIEEANTVQAAIDPWPLDNNGLANIAASSNNLMAGLNATPKIRSTVNRLNPSLGNTQIAATFNNNSGAVFVPEPSVLVS